MNRIYNKCLTRISLQRARNAIVGAENILIPINHENYNLREKKNSKVWKGKICIKNFYTVSMVIKTENVIGWFKLQRWMWLAYWTVR